VHLAVGEDLLVLHDLVSLPTRGSDTNGELVRVIRLLHKLVILKKVRVFLHIQIVFVVERHPMFNFIEPVDAKLQKSVGLLTEI